MNTAPLPDKTCPACQGKDGKHAKIPLAYPWPFNLVAVLYIDCPYTPENPR